MDLKTFSRKKTDAQTRHDILRDTNTLNIGVEQSSLDHTPAKDASVPPAARHARWRRAATEKENAVVTQKQQLAEIKAYFEEVDRFDLVAETPSPSTKQRVVLHTKGSPNIAKPSPLRPILPTHDCAAAEKGPTESGNTLPDLATNRNQHEQAASHADAGRRKSIAPSLSRRVSTALVPEIASDHASRQLAAEGGTRRTSTWGLGRSWRHSLAPRFSLVGNRLVDSTKHLMNLARCSSVAAASTSLVKQSGTGLVPTAESQLETECDAKEKPPCQKDPASNDNETNGDTTKIVHVADDEPNDTLVDELDQLILEEKPVPVDTTIEQPSGLDQLLRYCGQLEVPSLEELLAQYVDLKAIRKIGEGTFGEAFKSNNCVLKIVPMEGDMKVNGETQKRAEDMLGEVAITQTLSSLAKTKDRVGWTDGFVTTVGVGVSRGCYPEALIKEWHRWDAEFTSENDAVDAFGKDQLYTVFAFEDGGTDLEHIALQSPVEVRSLLLQITLALAVAEEEVEFEHRDLHWGNVLVQRSGVPEVISARFRGVDLSVQTAGIRCTLIDFTLSRLRTLDGAVAFCNLAADPELFQGPKANVQADTYRRMKKLTKNRWEGFQPATNVAWLHYLADTCLAHKLSEVASADKAELRGFRKHVTGYSSASEALWDEYFKGCWSATNT